MKKLKINTSLEPMDEWTYESYVSDYIFENVCIEQNLDNVTIDGNLVSVNLKIVALALWNVWILFLIIVNLKMYILINVV